MTDRSQVNTCIWLEKDGLEAARFYTSLLPNSEVKDEHRFEHMVTGEDEGVQIIEFTLAGAPFSILQAGPHQEHNDMMSIAVTTKDQAETDRLWNALTANGGREVQCGWLKDRFGVPWQITPQRIGEFLDSGEKAKINAMLKAMHPMKKLDVAALEAAYDAA
ncbi:MAG: VOC family protein [Alphaproteobacteria bacterium]